MKKILSLCTFILLAFFAKAQTVTFSVLLMPPPANLTQNTNDNLIGIYQLDASGGDATLTSFTATVNGSFTTADVSNFHVYVSTTSDLSGATLFANVLSGTWSVNTLFTVNGSATIPNNTTRYVIITADVTPGAVNGRTLAVKSITGVLGDRTPDHFIFTPSITTYNPATGLGGGYQQTILGAQVTITPDHPNPGYISQNTNNNVIAYFQVVVGSYSSVTLNQLQLTTSGTYTNAVPDISNFHLLWNTAKSTIGATTPSGTSTIAGASNGQTLNFTGLGISFSASGTYWIILTADVTAAATINHTVNITTTASSKFTFTFPASGLYVQCSPDPLTAPNAPGQTILGAGTFASNISNDQPIDAGCIVASTNIPIYEITLQASGVPSTLQAINNLQLGGGYPIADLMATCFNLYYTTTPTFSTATPVPGAAAQARVASGATISFTGLSLLFNVTNPNAPITYYIWVTADFAAGAGVGDQFNINAPALSNIVFSTGNPSGSLVNGGLQQICAISAGYWSGLGVGGNWGTDNKWGVTAGGPYTFPWSNGNVATLEAGSGSTLTLTAPATVQTINALADAYQINAGGSPNYITLSSPANISVSTGALLTGQGTANPVFYGTNGLNKLGNGELRLGAAFGSTFTGDIISTNGKLAFGREANGANPSAFLPANTGGAGTNITVNSGYLTINGGNSAAVSLVYLKKLTLTGANVLKLQNTSGFFAFTFASVYFNPSTTSVSNTTFNASRAVPLDVQGSLIMKDSILGSGLVNITSQPGNQATFGTTNFSGPSSLLTTSTYVPFNGSFPLVYTRTINHISLGGSGDTTNTAATNVTAGTISDNGYAITFRDTTVSTSVDGGWVSLNAPAGPGGLTGNWTVGSGNNSFYLVINNTGALTSGNILVNNHAQLRILGNAASLTYTSTAPITLNGKGTYWSLSNTSATTGIFNSDTLSNGALFLENHTDGSNNTLANPIILNTSDATINAQTHAAAGTANWTLSGVISGTGGFTKKGKATLILSGNNTWTGGTTVRRDTVHVNNGSHIGTGALTMSQITSFNTRLTLDSITQTVSSLSTSWQNTTGTLSQDVKLVNGTVLTVNQAGNTTYGDGAVNTLTGIISGTGHLIKDGAGTLTLTGTNTYTGYTQVKGGTLQLNHTGGTTLPITNTVHIIGGTLRISTAQTLANLVLSGGNLTIDAGITLTITGTFTFASGTITNGGTISYSAGATLAYGGSAAQNITYSATGEWQSAAGIRPTNVLINNFSYTAGSLPAGNLPSGVLLSSTPAVATTVTVNGWLDCGVGLTARVLGAGAGTFILNGLTDVAGVTGTTTSGSNVVTVNSTAGMWIGMRVTGAGISDRSYITFINPLVANTIWLSSNATATASGVSLSVNTRGGLKVNRGNTGTSGHINMTTKTYNAGASYYFYGPSNGVIISTAFPTSGTFNNPVWDVYVNTTAGGLETVTQNLAGITVSDTIFMLSGRYVINGNTLTLNGYTYGGNGVATGSGSNLTGSATSNLIVGGTTSDNIGTLYFTPGSQLLNNLTMTRTITDATATLASRVTLGTDLTVGGTGAGTFTFTNGDFDINGNTLTLNGSLAGSTGAFIGSSTSKLTISGTTGTDLGGGTATIRFKPTFQTLNLLTMSRSGGTIAAGTIGRAVMGTALTMANLTLTNGVLATSSNLITWDKTGTMTLPGTYSDSYIATCDGTGATIAPAAGPPTPASFDGSKGFRINNVGSNIFFPVGHTYLRTPNRMMINNTGTASNMTVEIGTGDVRGTPRPRVDRIWYINSSATGVNATMQMYFTKQDWSLGWPVPEDEIETGFDYANIKLLQKNYSDNFINISTGADILNFVASAYGAEIYGQYTGMTQFTRFQVVNDMGEIILPVNIINLNAYQKGDAVKVDWTSLNELNVDRYEVQRSANATAFITLGSVKALDNGQPRIDYSFTDLLPESGDNFYRIKAVDKNGDIRYTNIVKVNIGGIRTGFAIYPNPVTGRQFTVQMSNLAQGKYLLQVYNVLGQQIMNRTIEYAGGSSVQNIILPTNARPGVYMLRITNGVKGFTQSLVVE